MTADRKTKTYKKKKKKKQKMEKKDLVRRNKKMQNRIQIFLEMYNEKYKYHYCIHRNDVV